MEALIVMGHSREDVHKYTPRNAAAWLFVGNKRIQRERRDLLALHFAAAQGDPKAIQKSLKDAMKDDDT